MGRLWAPWVAACLVGGAVVPVGCGGGADPAATPESTRTWVYRTPTPTAEPATPTPMPAGISALVAEWVETELGGQYVGPCESPAPLRPNSGAPYCIATVTGDAASGLRVGLAALGSDADSWWLTFMKDASGSWQLVSAEPVAGPM